jgi:hypothetical protein
VAAGSALSFSNSKTVISRQNGGSTAMRPYDVSPDGKQFLIMLPDGTDTPGARQTEMHIVLNWFTELQQHVPVK